MAPQLLLNGADVTCDALADVQISRGRNHPAENYDPSTMTVSFVEPTASTVERGQTVDFALDAPASNPTWNDATGTWAAATGSWASQEVRLTLFRGYVTDLAADWRVGALGPLPVVKILATDPLGHLANQMVGDTPWPAETCAARASRIAGLVGISLTVLGTGPTLLARDVDRQPALDLLDAASADGSTWGGVFYDPVTDAYIWTLGDERNTTTPAATLDDCQISDNVTAAQVVSDVANDVTVTYGSPQVEVHSQDATSVMVDGYRHTSISTALANTVDAQARADTHVQRYSVPVWKLDNVNVSSGVLDPATDHPLAEALLKMPLGSRLAFTDLPKPTDAFVSGYLEGWSFDMHDNPAVWSLGLKVSPVQWSGPLLAWTDAGTVAATWAAVPTATTWQDVTGA